MKDPNQQAGLKRLVLGLTLAALAFGVVACDSAQEESEPPAQQQEGTPPAQQ